MYTRLGVVDPTISTGTSDQKIEPYRLPDLVVTAPAPVARSSMWSLLIPIVAGGLVLWFATRRVK